MSDLSDNTNPLNPRSGISLGVEGDFDSRVVPSTILNAHANSGLNPNSVIGQLYNAGYEFDFFQAVTVLEQLDSASEKVGVISSVTGRQAVKFGADSSSASFAPSAIHEVVWPTLPDGSPKIIVSFMGLTGPSGILPPHYTELLRRVEYEGRGKEKRAMREWFDLFNNRITSLFYLAWKKYRPYSNHLQALVESQDSFGSDDFSRSIRSVTGLGLQPLLRSVNRFTLRSESQTIESDQAGKREHCVADSSTAGEVRDLSYGKSGSQNPAYVSSGQKRERAFDPSHLALMRWSGLLAQRPRNASNLCQLLEDFFQLPFQVEQFHGNWMALDEAAQSQLGIPFGNSVLGGDAVLGSQTWERQNKILIRLGPLSEEDFEAFMPNHQCESAERDFSTDASSDASDNSTGSNSRFGLLCDLIRLFVGPELDVDIQLTIPRLKTPCPELSCAEEGGMRLGWNTWLDQKSENRDTDTLGERIADDTVFCNVA